MKGIRGILVLKLDGAMYSKAAADDVVNTLLLNGYTVTLEQINTSLYIEYLGVVTDEASLMFPLIKQEGIGEE